MLFAFKMLLRKSLLDFHVFATSTNLYDKNCYTTCGNKNPLSMKLSVYLRQKVEWKKSGAIPTGDYKDLDNRYVTLFLLHPVNVKGMGQETAQIIE